MVKMRYSGSDLQEALDRDYSKQTADELANVVDSAQ